MSVRRARIFSRNGIFAEVAEGHLVLGLDPFLDLGGVVVLEPAVGIGDLDAEIIVDLIDRFRDRIFHAASLLRAARRDR